MQIKIPTLSLVVLIGPSGAGKSTFARKHFLPTEVLSSDYCRGLVSDDENDQTATGDAFRVLHFIAARRLALGKLTVVDATNVQPEARKPLVELARQFHCLPVAIVLNPSERLCQDRNRNRANRKFGPHVIAQQRSQLRRSIRGLGREGFRHVFVLESPDEIDAAFLERVPLWNDRRQECGPFDIIGDIHGCCDELEELLLQLGYQPSMPGNAGHVTMPFYSHPDGRKAIFVGDLVDRGPRVLDSLVLVRNMVQSDAALCVPGNHDAKLLRALQGRPVQVTHGLNQSLNEIASLDLPADENKAFCDGIIAFLDSLISHYVLDGGRLVVAHAGMKQEMQGRGSRQVRDFALYGETTGETDEFGLPVRHNWAAEYRGPALVVYGHTPVLDPEWLNRTINIDTGCVFGGKLTALRYPEKELVSVAARRTYCQPARPFPLAAQQVPTLTAQQVHDNVLDAADVLGKRIIATRLRGNVTIREENATAALEVMSRFAANPKWLIYLPPTMSPSETTSRAGLLEHPDEAFAHFRDSACPHVVCQQKHMGSRAVVIICQDEMAARQRFGIAEDEIGIVYTRTGRRFFADCQVERQILSRLQAAFTATGFWSEFHTTWVCLDCELMPWSSKAMELLRSQYAATGAAGRASLPPALTMLNSAARRLEGEDLVKLQRAIAEFNSRADNIEKFIDAYRQYCWTVQSIDDLKLAPFHLLATEGQVHVDKSHIWHLETLCRVSSADPDLLLATPFKLVDVTDADSQAGGALWWADLTDRGGEGMVVKPCDFIFKGPKGLAQPALKCRGREYLRIIYGPDYTQDENLIRLRNRSLSGKRSLALREFALGIEALERFVRREPLRRVHECVFGVLALESEPVDPRL